jgi:DNA repair exonuclease SbcCD ATPase subunit
MQFETIERAIRAKAQTPIENLSHLQTQFETIERKLKVKEKTQIENLSHLQTQFDTIERELQTKAQTQIDNLSQLQTQCKTIEREMRAKKQTQIENLSQLQTQCKTIEREMRAKAQTQIDNLSQLQTQFDSLRQILKETERDVRDNLLNYWNSQVEHSKQIIRDIETQIVVKLKKSATVWNQQIQQLIDNMKEHRNQFVTTLAQKELVISEKCTSQMQIFEQTQLDIILPEIAYLRENYARLEEKNLELQNQIDNYINHKICWSSMSINWWILCLGGIVLSVLAGWIIVIWCGG